MSTITFGQFLQGFNRHKFTKVLPIVGHSYLREIEVPEFDKEKNIERVIFKPYNALVPNKDGYAKEYPVSFDCANIKDGCICYTVTIGSCKTGLLFLHTR